VICAGRGVHVHPHAAVVPRHAHRPLDVMRPVVEAHYMSTAPPAIAPPGVDTNVQPLLPAAALAAAHHLPPPGIPLGPPPLPRPPVQPLVPATPHIPPLLPAPPGLGAHVAHGPAVMHGTAPPYPLTGQLLHYSITWTGKYLQSFLPFV